MKTARAQERVREAQRLEAAGETRRAEREYRAALEIAPREPTALSRLALLLCARGEFAKAVPLFRRAAQIDPTDALPWLNLAAAFVNMGDEAAAARAFDEALAADPGNRKARLNVAHRLRCESRFEEAAAHYDHLLALDARDGVARWERAALAGLAGDLDAAFAGFAHEHAMKLEGGLPRHLPRWAGEPLAGRRILLEAEQGLGDGIMFSRLIPRVRDAGGRVILRAGTALKCLLADFDGVERFVPSDTPRPSADLWYALADLPALFGTSALAAASPPYLSVDPGRRAIWARRLPRADRPRVGLVWAGGPDHLENHRRSMPLATLLAPLLPLEGIEWVSLQKGAPAAEAEGTALIRADLDIADFQDTAAALERVDLLICVDTSILHLAGALDRPVWGLLAHVPDWRWMLGRSDSPWYPSLRLFRQPAPGDWASVTAELVAALRTLAAPGDPAGFRERLALGQRGSPPPPRW